MRNAKVSYLGVVVLDGQYEDRASHPVLDMVDIDPISAREQTGYSPEVPTPGGSQ